MFALSGTIIFVPERVLNDPPQTLDRDWSIPARDGLNLICFFSAMDRDPERCSSGADRGRVAADQPRRPGERLRVGRDQSSLPFLKY